MFIKLKVDWLRVSGFDSPTFQVIIGPPSQLTCLAGKLILDDLIVLACGADPTAAHLALPDHLHTERPDINDEGVTDILVTSHNSNQTVIGSTLHPKQHK